jgi:hypothetical protein
MRPLSKRERTERVLTALACNIAPTDEELEANVRQETYQYDRRIARQRAAREEFERRHGKKPV